MTKIIQLDDKLQHTKEKKAEIIRKQKILAVQKIFQCTQCIFKCEKCGTQIAHDQKSEIQPAGNLKIPYRFCESCSEEYADYLKRLQGKVNPECYWHNQEWIEVWNKWIDYQSVFNHYLESKELRRLLNELKETGPET